MTGSGDILHAPLPPQPDPLPQTPPVPLEAAIDTSMRFLARQPIMSANRHTFGYELLFRNSWENRFSGEGESASSSIVDWAITHGFDSLVGPARPFVNCTRSLLLSRCAELLPKNTVLEILETIEVDEQLLQACRRYRDLGFTLALDDYDFREQWEPLLDLVHYIKVDFSQTSSEDRRRLIARLKGRGIRFLAERIETAEDLQLAVSEGFELFQGYFFMKPIMTARRAPGRSIHQIQLLAEIGKQNLDLNALLRILRAEPAICYRLLRYVNSVSMAVHSTITDIRRAVLLIGTEESRRIIRTALAAELARGSCTEAMERCVQRARFCELLADCLGTPSEELYLMGMLSAVMPLLDLDPKEVVANLPLRPEVLNALLAPDTDEPHAHALTLAIAYEHGDWDAFTQYCQQLCLGEAEIADKHISAVQWTADIMHHI